MPNLTSVGITAGVPTSGTGTVSTLDGIIDATNGPVAIKAASTAPTATDKALVVAISPNGQLSGQQAMASSAPVVVASDQSSIAMKGDATTGTAETGSMSPVKQGFYATTAQSGLTLVSNAQRANGISGVDGVQIIRPHTNLEDIVSGVLANTDGASTAVIAAQGAGIKVYVTTVIIANTSATAVTVDLRDGTAGSVKATFPVPANTSGVVCNLPVPLGFSANTAVAMDGSAAASTVTCTLIGFKSKI